MFSKTCTPFANARGQFCNTFGIQHTVFSKFTNIEFDREWMFCAFPNWGNSVLVDPVLSLASEYSHILAPPGEWSAPVKKARVLYIAGWVAILRCASVRLVTLYRTVGAPGMAMGVVESKRTLYRDGMLGLGRLWETLCLAGRQEESESAARSQQCSRA